ncbi:MAG: hybrid sensor histidine kinase/response regulator [Chitinophagaceae bacterium]
MLVQEKIKILYIDDEINNLIGFKASFRVNYTIFTANNISAAYEQLDLHPDLRIIFCDQRMPDKTGVQFFEDMREKYPHPIRILLTGYTDVEAVIEAINRSNIYRYVKKPWVDADIISAIEEGNRFYMVNSMISIKNEELQKAYDELDKFAYSVTHDIRRPLLSILGAIDVAQYIDTLAELKQMLHMMEESVKNLDGYIKDIHDYYNLRRGELNIEEINFHEIVKVLEDAYGDFARSNRIQFIINISQREPFRTDKISINMILNNLLANAFKYQRVRESNKLVELTISVETGMLTISIKDNGIGIQENHTSQIFDMFFRASVSETGSGFGLYNVKNALVKLNGVVKVDTQIGKGSVFTVSIPNK